MVIIIMFPSIPRSFAARQGSRGKDIVMFGHTHKPYLDTEDGITILNPGSLSYPRQEGRRSSYMIMTIDEAGEAAMKSVISDKT